MKGGEKMNLKQRLTTTFTTGAIVLNAFVPTALASDITISDNGFGSSNRVSLQSENRTNIQQHNNADFRNDIRVNANTGNNRASFNTGGRVSIQTGDAQSHVSVSHNANTNNVTIGNSDNGNGNGNGSHNNKTRLFTRLSGDAEVPGPGDPNGRGRARVIVNTDSNEICLNMRVRNIEPANAAHIHEAGVGESGPVVVTLPTPDSNGHVNGCVGISDDLANEIVADPEEYYINVHNSAYPNGAVRGQLSL